MAGPLSRIAIGCDQQLICWVVSPPAQHHTGAEHAQHLIGEKTAVIWAAVQCIHASRRTVTEIEKAELSFAS